MIVQQIVAEHATARDHRKRDDCVGDSGGKAEVLK